MAASHAWQGAAPQTAGGGPTQAPACSLAAQGRLASIERQRREELLSNLSVGDVVSGRVSSLAGFGAFVDIGGANGLVHISEISHEMVNDPKEVLQIGQEVRVRVIKLDPDKERIGLSIKQLQPSPWDDIYSRLFAGQVVSATIVNVAPFGAFAASSRGWLV